jgi:hypothetical protein
VDGLAIARANALSLNGDAQEVPALGEGGGRRRQVDGEGAARRAGIGVIEIIQELFCPDGLEGRQRSLNDFSARNGVRGGVDVDGEGRESILGRVGRGIDAVIFVILGALGLGGSAAKAGAAWAVAPA